jgi:hypothetical protein
MQTLEFVIRRAAGLLDHARHCKGVVGGKLRIKPRPLRQQLAHAGDIAKVGHGFAGKDRVIRQAAFLRPFDLSIPVGAFNEPHSETAAKGLGRRGKPVDHGRGALLVGLNR